jgi:hypothetical protein
MSSRGAPRGIRYAGMRNLSPLLLLSLLALSPLTAWADGVLLDDFEQIAGWTAVTSAGAQLSINSDSGYEGQGMRLDFEFQGAGGYVNVQKTFSLPLPENYDFSFYLRGEAPKNNFEFKLVDPTGQNVWWRNLRNFEFPKEWQRIRVKKARFEKAWGPAKGAVLDHVSAIEFTVAAGTGGKGSVWIDEVQFHAKEPADNDETPLIRASTSFPGHAPEHLLDENPQTTWRSEVTNAPQHIVLDFLRNREYGGLLIEWGADDYATAYEVLVSGDGDTWTHAFRVTNGNGGRDYVYMPDAESRFVRLNLERSSRGQGFAIAEIEVKPFAFSASINHYFSALAKESPRGSYPKYFDDQQTYWTVIGVNGDDKEALINEEGMLEVEPWGFSIEPFLYVEGDFLSWSSVETAQTLEDGYLPIPSVEWKHEAVSLKVTALATGQPWLSTLYSRYRVENRGPNEREVRLFLALRPFQVNPPWQSLKKLGGATAIRTLRAEGRRVHVNEEKAILTLTPPDAFGAASFEEGSITDFLRMGNVPAQSELSDHLGYASGALRYDLKLPPGEKRDVVIAVPFYDPSGDASPTSGVEEASGEFEQLLASTAAEWRSLLHRVVFDLPPQGQDLIRTVKTAVAHILVNRDEAALQPGPRTYARSWIRDGAISAAALLEMGFAQEAAAFVRWFAPHQFDDGKVPCCVDERGADPTPEHDSHGQLIYAVAECFRHTRDVGFLTDMWPRVLRAAKHIGSLREQRLTEEFQSGGKRLFYGLLPESISHEGYASHPVHSYWDDFFALLGLKDAAFLAEAFGDFDQLRKLVQLRDSLRNDLYASIAAAMEYHGIDYIPGAADLGDFDPTSTAIAITPGGEAQFLPQPALQRTFERYLAFFRERREGNHQWEAYTPYETRNAAAFIRLDQPEQAREVLDFVLADRRPVNWNQWGEIVWRDPSAAMFIGDMPHTWIGASFIRSVRAMFAYERESDRALVLAAGLPAEWVIGEAGVAVTRLPTHYGVLSYRLRAENDTTLRLQLRGTLTMPPGRIVLRTPMAIPLQSVTVNGKPTASFNGREAVLDEIPADVILAHGASE